MPKESKHTTKRQHAGVATAVTVVGGSLVFSGTPVQAVSPEVNSLADTVDASDGVTTLREAFYAVALSSGTQTISFAPGLSGVIDITARGTLFVPNANLTIAGPGSDQITLRNTAGTALYVYGTTNTKTISGISIDQAGAHAVVVRDAGLVTLDNVNITNTVNAGLYIAMGGNVVVRNSTISGGGADAIRMVGTSATGNIDRVTLDRSDLDGNAGKGIHATLADKVTITDSTISGGSDTAVRMVGNLTTATLDVVRSTISGNTSTGLSGISVYKGNTQIENSTITANSGAGTTLFRTGNVGVSHSTLSGNTGTGAVINLEGSASDATLNHSIVSANGSLATINVGNSGLQVASWSIVGADVTTEFTGPGSGNVVKTNSPQLGALAENGGLTATMMPATSSPAMNSGDPAFTGAPTTDQTGIARVVGRIDIGAVEREVNSLVVTTANGPSNDGQTSFGEAIAVANSNADASTITFAPTVTGTITLASTAVVTTNTTIAGPGAGVVTLTAPGLDAIKLDGPGLNLSVSDITVTGSQRGISADNAAGAALTVDHVVVTASTGDGLAANGLASASVTDSSFSDNGGVGIALTNSPATLTRVTVDDNGSPDTIGGGVRFAGTTTALVDESIITNNTSRSGAGIRFEDGDLTVRDSSVSFNVASDAGTPGSDRGRAGGVGVFDGDGAIVVENSTVSGNTAMTSGAGVVLEGNTSASPTLAIDASTISANTSLGANGGVSATAADVTVVNSTIALNAAVTGGSGIHVADAALDVAHSTIAANTTPLAGAGVSVSNTSFSADHTILADNQNDDFTSSGSSVSGSTYGLIGASSLGELAGSNNIGTSDAGLGALANNGGPTHTLLPGASSPAIDAGDLAITGAPTTDQRGMTRIIDTIDIGAVETPEVLDPGVLDISPAVVSVDEEGASLTLTVTRSAGSLGAASVDVASSYGTATAADFTAVATTLAWADGEDGAKTVTVNITPDTDIEADEQFTVALSGYVGAVAGTTTSSTVTIIDNDDVGTISLSPATLDVAEGGTSATLTISRTGGTDGAASVDVATADDTAAAGADYDAVSTTFTWADGESDDKTLTVAITDDSDAEIDETFNVTLSAISGATPGATVSSVVTIIDDDDVGVIDLSPASTTVDESSGDVTMTVTRSGGSDGPATVDLDTADGTALAGSDYTATNATATWADGESGAKTVTIPITDDTVEETDEDFTATLSGFTGAAAGAVTASTITIGANDAPVLVPGVIDIAPAAVSIAEDGSSVALTVTRSAGSDGAATVNVATATGTATAADFTAVNTTLTWADGVAGDQTVTIPITDDSLIEADETFTVALSAPIGASLGTATTSTITIIDNDEVGVIDVSPATLSVNEGAGTATLSVTRSGGSDGAASVAVGTTDGSASVGTTDGSASVGTDFTAPTPSVTWADGESGSKSITIPITDDSLVEADEDFDVVLSDFVGAAAGSITTSTITIVDNDDTGVITISPGAVSLNEANTTVTFNVARSGGTDGIATVDVATVDGTATAGSDYTATSTSLSWADGETGPKTVTIPITDDAIIEADETFDVALSNIAGATSGSITTSTVTILDNDDVGSIAISPASIAVDEADGTVTLDVARTGGSDGAATVDVATANGTATAGNDYTAATATLSWANGETGTKTITIDIADDTTIEADETFTVALSDFVGAAEGSTTSSTVTIIDNDDTGVITISPGAVSITEANTTVALTVTRSGGTDGAASATVKTTNGTATAGSDYTAVDTTVTWADGESGAKTVTVDIADDTTIEADETFTVGLSDITGATAGSSTTSTVTIIDNDETGTIAISPASIAVDEDSGSVTLNVSRTGGSDGVATVDVDTADGTALAGSDYTAAGTTLSWADGESGAKPVTIAITNDTLEEADEDFTVTLSGVVGASAGASTSTVTIRANDLPVRGVIDISPATLAVNEDGGPATLTVTRSAGSDGVATVDVATSDGTATSADFTPTTATLTWADGESGAKTVTIPITDDGLVEANETFGVSLSSFAGASAGTITSSTVTIIDNERAGVVNISPTVVSVGEAAGSTTLTLSRTNGSDGPLSVRVKSVGGTARGADYVSFDTTVNWAAGESTAKTISVVIIDDTLNEADEVFTVELSDLGTPAVGTSTVSTITIIDNDDVGTIAISPLTLDVNESGGIASLTVTRSGGSDGAAAVRATSVAGTAGSADFVDVDLTFAWADGQTGAKTMIVPIKNDDIKEPTEQFTVELSNHVGALAGATTSTITIADDDGVGEINLSPATVSIGEANTTVRITATRSGGSDGQAWGIISTSNGSASAGADYGQYSKLVSWPDGQDGAKVFDIVINDDSFDEADETFTVAFTNSVGAPVGIATSTVTIIDDDMPAPPEPTSFVTPVAPARVVDTRGGGDTLDGKYEKGGRIKAGQTLRVDIGGRATVPKDAQAVIVNVTSVRGNGGGFLTVHPCLTKTPGASTLNFDGSNTPNEIIAGLSSTGQLCVFSSTETDVLIDVVGYIDADSAYAPLAPARLLETRPGQNTTDGKSAGGGPLGAGKTLELKVRGRAGVTADATAVVVNVTSIQATDNGYITVHPCLAKEPGASSLNFNVGANRANEIIAQVSPQGTICLFASTKTGLLVDVVGQLNSAAGYSPVAPARLVDSRAAGTTIDGKQQRIGRQGDNSKLMIDVVGRAGVPNDAKAVVVNLTAVRPSGTGYFTTFNCGNVPNASSLNYATSTVANELVVDLNDSGNFCIFTARDTDVLIDVVGYL